MAKIERIVLAGFILSFCCLSVFFLSLIYKKKARERQQKDNKKATEKQQKDSKKATEKTTERQYKGKRKAIQNLPKQFL